MTDTFINRIAGSAVRLHRAATALARVADEWLVALSKPVPSWPSEAEIEQARAAIRALGERLDGIETGIRELTEARKEAAGGK